MRPAHDSGRPDERGRPQTADKAVDVNTAAHRRRPRRQRGGIGPAVNAWRHLHVCGLDSELVWHALFGDLGLCSCSRCKNGGDR
jgi:hypothetical protein